MNKVAKILATLLIVIATAELINYLLSKIDILESVTSSISNFDLTDIYFSNGFSYQEQNNVQNKILLVNVSPHGRGSIAEQINIINKYEPSVVVMNSFFRNFSDSTGAWNDTLTVPSIHDYALKEAFSKVEHLVFMNRITNDSINSMIRTDRFFVPEHAKEGFGNTNEKTGYETIRNIPHSFKTDSTLYLPMTLEAASFINSDIKSSYLKRANKDEMIYYTGYYISLMGERLMTVESSNLFLNALLESRNVTDNRFFAIDWDQLLEDNFVPELIKGKIVLIGYMGEFLGDWDRTDKLYTPLNSELFQLENRPADMYDVEIHANVIDMFLSNNLIYQSSLLSWFVGVPIMVLTIWFYLFLLQKINKNYQLISKIFLIVQINALIIFALLVFHYFHWKTDIKMIFLYLFIMPDMVEILDSNKMYQKIDSGFSRVRLKR